MLSIIVGKLGYGISVMLGVVLLLSVIFFAFLNKSADPAKEMVGQRADEKTLNEIRREYALDKPVLFQFFFYLNDLSPISLHSIEKESLWYANDEKYTFAGKLKLGSKVIAMKMPYLRKSYQSNKPVASILLSVIPNTLLLAFTAILISLLLGVPAGVIAAIKKGSAFDSGILFLTTLGVSTPSFFVALGFATVFGFYLHDITGLPVHGSLFTTDDLGNGRIFTPANLILPAITLGIRPLAIIVQITRNSMLDVLKSDYVRTARAKGLSERKVIFKHTLRNALNPVISSASNWFAGMLAGSVFVEYIFGWNGIGKEIVNSLQMLDYPVIMGALLSIAFMYVLLNIVTDILYTKLDPTIQIK